MTSAYDYDFSGSRYDLFLLNQPVESLRIHDRDQDTSPNSNLLRIPGRGVAGVVYLIYEISRLPVSVKCRTDNC